MEKTQARCDICTWKGKVRENLNETSVEGHAHQNLYHPNMGRTAWIARLSSCVKCGSSFGSILSPVGVLCDTCDRKDYPNKYRPALEPYRGL